MTQEATGVDSHQDNVFATHAPIQKVAVIGSGVMGAGIAAHCANAGCEVLLLDIIPEDVADRNSVARHAIESMLNSNPEMLMHKRNSERVTAGNIEDDLPKLKKIGRAHV